MDFKEYQEKAKRTLNILPTKGQDQIHMLLGLASEVGELQDAYKKHLAYGKDLDLINVKEELGDVLWYIANMCTILELNMHSIAETNINKLMVRYPNKFSNKCATIRDLYIEREILEK